jgi:hypothetical protein
MQLFPPEATAQRVLELYDERIAEIAIDADALTNQDALLYDVTCNRLEAAMSATGTNERKKQRAACYKYEIKKQRAEGTTTTQAPCTDM